MGDEFRPIQDVIPHRAPFVFLSRILALTSESIVAEHNFEHETFFAGHFPENPIVPGVILIEGLAQSLAYLALSQVPKGTVLLTGIDRCKVRSPVYPGDTVQYRVEVLKHKLGLVSAAGTVSIEDRLVLSTHLKGYISDE